MATLVISEKLQQLPRFEVEKLEGESETRVCKKTENGLEWETVMQPNGWMVYFPAGHSIHIRSEKELRRLGFHRRPGIALMNEGEQTEDEEDDQPVSLKRIVSQKTQPPRRVGRSE